MYLGRQMVEEKSDAGVDGFRLDKVIVVQDKGKTLRDGGDVVAQSCEHRLDGWRRGGMKKCPGSLTNSRLQCFQGGDEVVPETYRVIIPFIQRQPGGRRSPLALICPFAYQRGLAKAGRCRDEYQSTTEN